MSEEIKQDEQEQEVSVDTVTQEQVDQLSKQLELIKKAQQGVDRKNTELVAENNELKEKLESIKTQDMGENEKVSYELQRIKEEHDAIKLENEKLRKDSLVNQYIIEKKIDPKLKKYLNADTIEELDKQASELLDIINTTTQARVEERVNSKVPLKGDTHDNYQEAWDKMNLSEKMEAYKKSPEKYEKLI